MSLSPGSWPALAASGSMRVHQFITQSDLEKKRWPPMSMRLPLNSTDCDKPPMLRVASSTTISRTPASASSQAAVRPAGPAPMITTRSRLFSIFLVPRKQQELARHKIEAEYQRCGNKLGLLGIECKLFHAGVDHQLVDPHAGEADQNEYGELDPGIGYAPFGEHPAHAEQVDQREPQPEADRGGDKIVHSCETA